MTDNANFSSLLHQQQRDMKKLIEGVSRNVKTLVDECAVSELHHRELVDRIIVLTQQSEQRKDMLDDGVRLLLLQSESIKEQQREAFKTLCLANDESSRSNDAKAAENLKTAHDHYCALMKMSEALHRQVCSPTWSPTWSPSLLSPIGPLLLTPPPIFPRIRPPRQCKTPTATSQPKRTVPSTSPSPRLSPSKTTSRLCTASSAPEINQDTSAASFI